jgi:hypothetical protein
MTIEAFQYAPDKQAAMTEFSGSSSAAGASPSSV